MRTKINFSTSFTVDDVTLYFLTSFANFCGIKLFVKAQCVLEVYIYYENKQNIIFLFSFSL